MAELDELMVPKPLNGLSSRSDNLPRDASPSVVSASDNPWRSPIDLATFWSRVRGATTFQCWPWTGQKNDKGYGRFRGHAAHRLAYALVNGPIPEGLLIRHRCDNPACCNPNHLEPGTHADNARDAVERGQAAIGDRHGKTKLTWDNVRQIKTNPGGLKLAQLARQFGVSKATVSYIRSGRSWKMAGSARDPSALAGSSQ